MVAVSVVCPVYCHTEAHKRYLREALESVAAQTFRDFELLLVDDLSPIDIAPIVESVGGLPTTRILRNAANLGHAESRNVGVRAAEADLIAFIDHDDLWLPDKLAQQVQVLGQNPDAAMVFCDVDIIRQAQDDERGARDDRGGASPYVDQRTVPERPSLIWLLTHNNCVITVSSVLVQKQALVETGLFDSRYSSCDDFDAWIKLRCRAPIVHMRETLARYRLHEHNVNYSVDRLNDNRLLTERILSSRQGLSIYDHLNLTPTLAKKLTGRVVWSLRRILGR